MEHLPPRTPRDSIVVSMLVANADNPYDIERSIAPTKISCLLEKYLNPMVATSKPERSMLYT